MLLNKQSDAISGWLYMVVCETVLLPHVPFYCDMLNNKFHRGKRITNYIHQCFWAKITWGTMRKRYLVKKYVQTVYIEDKRVHI